MGRRLRLVLAAGAIVPVAVIATARSCAACSCVTDDPRAFFASADVVFRGVVTEDEEPSWLGGLSTWFGGEPPEARATLRVDETWKGTVPSEVDVLAGPGSCAITFTEGVEYIVYGDQRDDDTLVTGVCEGTISTDHAAEVEALLSDLGPATPTAG